jgi:hypothetical protein
VADYNPTTWVDDDGSGTVGTPFTAARMNQIEAGIDDAAEHNKRGTLASRPAAAAANKNWLWTDSATGQTYYSDGSTWTRIGPQRSAQTGTVLESQATSGTTTNFAVGGVDTAAASFDSGAGGDVGAVELYLRHDSTLRGLFIVSIAADNAGQPNNTNLASSPIAISYAAITTLTTPIVYRFPFAGLTLTPGTTYWIKVAVSNLSGTGQWGVGIAGGTPPGKYAERTSGVWTVTNTKSLRHAVILNNETVVDASAETADSVLRGGVQAAGHSSVGVEGRTHTGRAGILGRSQKTRGVEGLSTEEIGVRGNSAGSEAGVEGSSTGGPGVRGQVGSSQPGVLAKLGPGSGGDMFKGEDFDGNSKFRVDSTGMMAQAAKGSVRNSYFHDAFRAVVSGVNPIATITGLTAFTAVKEYDLTIAGAIVAGGVNRNVYLQPNAPNHGGRYIVHRSYSSGGTAANDNSNSTLSGSDPSGCFIGGSDWNTDCEIFIFCRITLDGWTRYLYYEATYYNASAANVDNMLMGRVAGIWYPPTTPVTDVTSFTIGLTGGTFSGGVRLRGYGT